MRATIRRKQRWEGYDAIAQTDDAIRYIQRARGEQALPARALLGTAPCALRDRAGAIPRAVSPDAIELRPNVPPAHAAEARAWLAGYYAHCTALDDCVGRLWAALEAKGIDENTIFVFTSDHGDMLGSQGAHEEAAAVGRVDPRALSAALSARVWPAERRLDARLDTPDIMPTLLGLCEIPIPDAVEGLDFSGYLRGGDDPSDGAALLQCPHPFRPVDAGARRS